MKSFTPSCAKVLATSFFSAALFSFSPLQAQDNYIPEEGSIEETQKKKKKKKVAKVDPNLPMVMILGDSISMGYTPTVKKDLAGKANIIHNPGNSQGTTYTLTQIDNWLKLQEWDVIHFNLGLHDLKRVKVAGTSENSDDKNDPYQADLATYEKNLKAIVAKLKASEAKLIFATTTTFPAGVSPYRDPVDVPKYNGVAIKIMKENGIPVNDLNALISPEIKTLQKPKNVHFHKAGSTKMGNQVSKLISELLPEEE